MEIRCMTIEDYDSVFALWNRTQGMGLGNADTREGIEAFLKRNPFFSFVAVERGSIVGAVMGGHDGRKGYIYHLAVDTDYRRRGIAKQLIERVKEAFKKQGIKKVCLLVFKSNDSGNAFWASAGFKCRDDINYYSIEL